MAITDFTTQEDTFFDVVEKGITERSFNGGKNARMELQFYLDKDVTFIEREIYNMFMLFGDVGGLAGLFHLLNAIIVYIFTYKNSENYLAETLYKRPA